MLFRKCWCAFVIVVIEVARHGSWRATFGMVDCVLVPEAYQSRYRISLLPLHTGWHLR